MIAISAVSHCGGPDIPLSLGLGCVSIYSDAIQSSLIPSEINLESDVLFHEYYERMGLNKVEMVALVTGSHTLGEGSTLQADLNYCVLSIDCNVAQDPDIIETGVLKQWAEDESTFFHAYKVAMGSIRFMPMSLPVVTAPFSVPKYDFSQDGKNGYPYCK
ncbi:hypothetical protein BC830DRAFT_1166984 [Chytriomyces sp. MP71]|nr:hypothetical protein BC830DRAFT_1166984 [Chytriomyces sp. MP71]